MTMRRTRLSLLLLALFGLLVAPMAEASPVQWRAIRRVKTGVYDVKAVYPVIPLRSAVAKQANQAFRQVAETATREVIRGAERDARESGRLRAPYALEMKSAITYLADDLVSGLITVYQYTGGAHGNTFFVPVNYGLVKGRVKKLMLADLLPPDADPVAFATEAALPLLNEQKRARGADEMTALDKNLINQFYFSQNGLTWTFAPYDVGAYAEGAYVVKAPWSRMEGQLDNNGPLRYIVAEEGARGFIVLAGTARYRERLALPPGVKLALRVVEVESGETIAEATFPAKGPPFRFEMTLQTKNMERDRRYELKVMLMRDGKVWFRNRDAVDVPRSGWEAPREILLVRGE
jgi:uncharacterized lipoprotein YbaY